jgi:exosortase
MPIVLFGLVLYVAGPAVAKLSALPIFYLCLAMPIPRLWYTQLATPLQELAAQSSCLLLRLFGVVIRVTASRLEIVSQSGRTYDLTVVEACSGVRSLIAYVALGVAWAYLETRPVWQRVALVLAAVPIALLCNVLRVAVTCSMFVADRPELGRDFMHEFMGLAMLVPAVVLFWLLGRLLGALYVEDDEEDDQPAPRGAGGKAEVAS